MLLEMFPSFKEIGTIYPNVFLVSRDINPLQLHVSEKGTFKSYFRHSNEVNSSFSSETSLNFTGINSPLTFIQRIKTQSILWLLKEFNT